MEFKKMVNINGVDVYFSLMELGKGDKFCQARSKINNKYDTCPICKSLVMKGSLYLIYNNWKMFPNTICHKDCVDSFKTIKDAILYMEKDYKKYLECKHWNNQ